MAIDLTLLPAINATLNGTSAILIGVGRSLIRRQKIQLHKRTMIAAVITSSLFLACYLYYHAHVGSVRFQGHGWSRPVYYTILISHTILAITVLPLVILSLNSGLRARYDRHRRISRWTYPIWMYVSVTGVVVYLMLYHLFRA